MNGTATGTPADPTPAVGQVDFTLSVPGKQVDINSLNYGDRPTTSYTLYAPDPLSAHLSGTARIAQYTVTVDWPSGAEKPAIIIEP